MKTFDPSFPSSSDKGITVEYPSERILLRGLSFDYVFLNDGYIEPCLPPKVEADKQPTQENLIGSISCHGDDKEDKSADVLPNENTAISSVKEDSEQINSSLPSVHIHAPLNVERNIKTLVRLLRKSLKKKFDDVYNKKHYYWNDTNLKKRTLKFFTELSDFEVPTEYYIRNEEAYFKLIHNTYDNEKHITEIG